MEDHLSSALELSRRHLQTAERLIAAQIALIKRLHSAGNDTRAAWQLLATFEDIQAEMLLNHQRKEGPLGMTATWAAKAFDESASPRRPSASGSSCRERATSSGREAVRQRAPK
jgi:hypothetical protein